MAILLRDRASLQIDVVLPGLTPRPMMRWLRYSGATVPGFHRLPASI